MDWLGLILAVTAPFIVFGLFVLGLLAFSAKSLLAALRPSAKKRKNSRLNQVLACGVVGILLIGVILLLQFGLAGGPNKGIGKFLVSSANNPYYQLQIGMFLVLCAGLLAFVVHGRVRRYEGTKLTLIIIISVAMLATGLSIYHSQQTRHDQQTSAYNAQQSAKLAVLPPIYIPAQYAVKPVDIMAHPIVLFFEPDDGTAYKVDFDGSPYVSIAGHHAAKVASLFDPSNGNCDVEGLRFDKPSAAVPVCSVPMDVRGGQLYVDTFIQTMPHRAEAVWVKDGSVYYIASGSSTADIIAVINSLKLVTTEQVQQYLIVD